MPRNPYRDELGRFARAPSWWRPRDARGRFRRDPAAAVRERGTQWQSLASAARDISLNVQRTGESFRQVSEAMTNVTTTFAQSFQNFNVTSTYRTPSHYRYDTATNSPTEYIAPRTRTVEVPTFICRIAVTHRELEETDDFQAILRRAQGYLIGAIRARGIEMANPDGAWEHWTRTDPVNDTTYLEVTWTPRPQTTEAWVEWCDDAVWKAARRPVEDRESREARIAREARERRAREEREQAREEERAKREREKEAARAKAVELMEAVLSDEQMDEFRTSRCFHIETADGTRRYKIRSGRAGNIDLVKDGEREAAAEGRTHLRRFCFHEYHPTERPPVEDNMLAQALFIMDNEEEFLRVANPA